MTVKECYDAMGGDYREVISRLRNDNIIKKFVLKFPAQSGFDKLEEAMEKEDYEAAFNAAHTLKGVCMNLNFTKLGESSAQLTELLRGGQLDQVPGLYGRVQEDYRQTVEAIAALDQ